MTSAHGADKAKLVRQMIVRLLEERDLPACIHLGAMMHEESDYRAMEYSPEQCVALGRRAMADPDYVWLVAISGEEAVGMIGGYVCRSFFGKDKVAQDFVVYVAPEHRGGRAFIALVRAFVAWAEQAGARKIHLASSAAITDVDRLYSRIGFDKIGSIYRRDV